MTKTEEIRNVRIITERNNPRPWHNTVYIKDAETGEILFSIPKDNVAEAIKNGDWARAEAVFDVTERSDGVKLFTVREMHGDYGIGTYGDKRPPRKRGGKKSYVKLYPNEILELNEREQLALLAVVPFLMPDGSLKKKWGKTMGATEVALLLARDGSERTGWSILKTLREKGVIYDDDGIPKLHRKFIGRG